MKRKERSVKRWNPYRNGRLGFGLGDTVKTVIRSPRTVLLDSNNNISYLIPLNSVAAYTDFIDYANIYTEVRVLKAKLTFYPGVNFNTGANYIHPVYVWPYHGVSPSVSEAVAINSSYCKTYPATSQMPMSATWLMRYDGEENEFRAATSAGIGSANGLAIFFDGGTGAGIEVGRLIEEYTLEFKTRRG